MILITSEHRLDGVVSGHIHKSITVCRSCWHAINQQRYNIISRVGRKGIGEVIAAEKPSCIGGRNRTAIGLDGSHIK